MSISLQTSSINFVDADGKEFAFSGLEYTVAAVCSPLVEEGSGQGLGHPETLRAKAVKVMVSRSIPVFNMDSADVAKLIVIPANGTKLAKGDAVISYKGTAFESWRYAEGIVVDRKVKLNNRTNTLNVKVQCLMIERSDAEKYRLGKYRSNGGFLRNIVITEGSDVIFNPNTSLYDGGKAIQAEHVVGAEEFKTLLFALGMVKNLTGLDTKWDSSVGTWSNDEALSKALETVAKRVTVSRWNLEASCYEMLKAMYKDDANFSFDDDSRGIVHSNVWCYYGPLVQIVEVPLTATFVGKCAMFAEHIHYLGTEYPALYAELLEDVKINQRCVKKAYEMVLGRIPGSTEEKPAGTLLIVDDETEIVRGDKLAIQPDDSGEYVETITIPEDREYSLELVAQLTRSIKRAGYSGFLVCADNGKRDTQVPIDFEVIRHLVGSESQNLFSSLVSILWCLEIPNDERAYDGWSSDYYRAVRLFEGTLEFLVGDSASFCRRAAKTSKLAFTCRAGSTIDASVRRDEVHIHPELMKEWGLTDGDLFLIGRVPVPGMGTLKVVTNELVPYGTVVVNAALKHAVEEGDVDGDSIVALAVTPEGKLIRPGKRVNDVNPIAD